MPNEIPQRVPLITLRINITHAAPQARLQILRMIAKQPHNQPPADTRKHRPGIVAHALANPIATDDRQRQPATLAHGEPRQRQHDARKHVYHNLLVDAADLAAGPRPPAKHKVAAQQARDQRVVGALGAFPLGAARPEVLERHARGFVDRRELGEVARVCFGRAEDEPEFFADTVRIWVYLAEVR